MKIANRYFISERVFTIEDLRRIASVFEDQRSASYEAKQNFRLKYTLLFDDYTSFEDEASTILENTTIVDIKRPVFVEFKFTNYEADRDIYLYIRHGNESSPGSRLTVEGTDTAWVNDIFIRIKTLIDAAKPQDAWPARYPVLMFNAVALGLGCLAALLCDLLATVISYLAPDTVHSFQSHLSSFSILSAFDHLPYLFGWLLRLVWGYTLGAFPIAKWMLAAWPDVELDFGAEHLKIEKKRRARFAAIVSLVVIPVLVSIVYDFVKGGMR